MYTVLVVSIIIVIVILVLAVGTTSKAYNYKHTVDPLENDPYTDQEPPVAESSQQQNNE
ncbi:YtzI protein [Neobacillus jeddahensis]|uniref:YtzI protein n=1 Tax=Neobacillus jeddahensis TaxID=1461580 RepID=UPI000945B6B0|nr:YtzI protein [Neobacillus jeddahensis]